MVDDERIAKLLFPIGNKFVSVEATNIREQQRTKTIQFDEKMIVYNMKLDCASHTVYAIIGYNGKKARLHSINLRNGHLKHVFDEEIRTDSKILLYHDKGLIMEPFKAIRMYQFQGTQMSEVDLDIGLWSLDDMEKSIKNNLLLVICEKKFGNQRMKYIKLINLSTLEGQLRDDVPLGSQSEPKMIKVCPKEQIVAISHITGELEIWRIDTLLNVRRPRADKIFKNLCNSDFVMFYQKSQQIILSLLNARHNNSKQIDHSKTYLII